MTVTKQQQLEWLAKNHNFTNQHVKYVVMSASEIGLIIGSGTSCNAGLSINCHVITREEWQQERNKMQKQVANDVSIFHFVSDEVLDENIKIMEQLGAKLVTPHKQDNSLRKRGARPPIGAHVELWFGGSFAYNCEFLCARGCNYIVWNLDADRPDCADIMNSEFRPLRTEREKAIDDMKSLCAYPGSWCSTFKEFAESLYDAGYRKVKP